MARGGEAITNDQHLSMPSPQSLSGELPTMTRLRAFAHGCQSLPTCPSPAQHPASSIPVFQYSQPRTQQASYFVKEKPGPREANKSSTGLSVLCSALSHHLRTCSAFRLSDIAYQPYQPQDTEKEWMVSSLSCCGGVENQRMKWKATRGKKEWPKKIFHPNLPPTFLRSEHGIRHMMKLDLEIVAYRPNGGEGQAPILSLSPQSWLQSPVLGNLRGKDN